MVSGENVGVYIAHSRYVKLNILESLKYLFVKQKRTINANVCGGKGKPGNRHCH